MNDIRNPLSITSSCDPAIASCLPEEETPADAEAAPERSDSSECSPQPDEFSLSETNPIAASLVSPPSNPVPSHLRLFQAPDSALNYSPELAPVTLDLSNQETADERIETGLARVGALLAEGDVRGAAETFEEIEQLARDYYRHGRFSESDSDAIPPWDRDLQYYDAVIGLLQNRESASRDASEVLAMLDPQFAENPDDPTPYQMRATLHDLLHQYAEAIEDLEEAADVSPDLEENIDTYRDNLQRQAEESSLFRAGVTDNEDPAGVVASLIEEVQIARALGDDEQARALTRDLHQTLAGWAVQAGDEPRRLYHVAHIGLLDGNIPQARLQMMDFMEATEGTTDTELQQMREEVGETLRNFALQAIDQLIHYNELITRQQVGEEGHRGTDLDGQTFFNERESEGREGILTRMRRLIESGRADTLEEAMGIVNRQYGDILFPPQLDPEGALYTLYQLETREGLERLADPQQRREYLLDVAKRLDDRDSAYQVGWAILQGLFHDEMETQLGACPPERLAELEAEVDREEIEERVAESGLRGQETREAVDRLVREEMGYRLMRDLHDDGRLAEIDPVADRAWEVFNDDVDPLGETWNLSSTTWDAVTHEAILTGVTLPATIGIGTLVRAGLGGTSFITNLAARGRSGAVLAETLLVGAGGVVEGIVWEGQAAFLEGRSFDPAQAGMNTLMSLAFHGGGRLWRPVSQRLRIDRWAVGADTGHVPNLFEVGLRQFADFSGSMTTQTAVATTFAEVQLAASDAPSEGTFIERLLGHAGRMLGYHFAQRGLNLGTEGLFHEIEGQTWQRLEAARQVGELQRGQEATRPEVVTPDPETAMYQGLSEAVALPAPHPDGVIGRALRWAMPLATAALSVFDSGVAAAMIGVGRSGTADFYGYESAARGTATEAPWAEIDVPGRERSFVDLRPGQDSWTIGRSEQSDIPIPDLADAPRTSFAHATLQRRIDPQTGETIWVFQDHSSNGTWIQGQEYHRQEVLLQPGVYNVAVRSGLGDGWTRIRLVLPRTTAAAPHLGDLSIGTSRRTADDIPGISGGTHEGIGYADHNEDRFVAVSLPDGRTIHFAIDGMGGHAGGERAAAIAESVLGEAVRDGASLSEAIQLAHQAINRDNSQQSHQSRPGAVAVGVEVIPRGPGDYLGRFAVIGDAETVVYRLSDRRDPVIHRTTHERGRPIGRGQTLEMHIDPRANVVDQALGENYEIRIGESTVELREGDIILSGSDGFFENFTNAEIVSILRDSGARTASEIRQTFMTAALIRMEILRRAEGQEIELTGDLYRAAYETVTGVAPARGWRGMYEGYRLTEPGHVVDPRTGRIVAHFKADNLTLVAQVVGEGQPHEAPSHWTDQLWHWGPPILGALGVITGFFDGGIGMAMAAVSFGGTGHFFNGEERPAPSSMMTDRNRTENHQASAIVNSAQGILHRDHRLDISTENLIATYHTEIAPNHKDALRFRRNAGGLENYRDQVQELVAHYLQVAAENEAASNSLDRSNDDQVGSPAFASELTRYLIANWGVDDLSQLDPGFRGVALEGFQSSRESSSTP